MSMDDPDIVTNAADTVAPGQPTSGGSAQHAVSRTSSRTRVVVAAWLCSDVVSLFGTALSSLAVPWMVLNLTHNTAATGVVSAVQLGTLVLANLVSGPLIDRLGPTRISVFCDYASACFIALIPLLWALHLFSIPALIAIVAVVGALRGPSNSAKSVLSPTVAQFAKQPMERITGLSGTTERLASTIGSAAGGVIIGLVGGPYALAFTALGLIIGATLISFIVRPALLPLLSTPQPGHGDEAGNQKTQHRTTPVQTTQAQTTQTEASSKQHARHMHTGLTLTHLRAGISTYMSDIADGWKSLIAIPTVFGLALIPAITNMIDIAWTDVLAPAWVISQHHGSQTLGLLFAALTFPAIISSLLATILASRLPRFPVFIVGYLLAGAPRYIAMAMNAPMNVVLMTMVIGGIGSGFLNPILGAVLYERMPEQSRGKIISLTGALTWGLMPIGSLMGGFMSHLIGLQSTLAILGVIYFLVTMTPLAVPALRDFKRIQTP